MPLDQFIDETLTVLDSGADEVVVDAGKMMRGNVGPTEHEFVNAFNAQMRSVLNG
jgi:uncharacterized oxidoreductase